jgi:hypothetical protein
LRFLRVLAAGFFLAEVGFVAAAKADAIFSAGLAAVFAVGGLSVVADDCG